MALSGRLGECPCGSGEWPEELFDARGIFRCGRAGTRTRNSLTSRSRARKRAKTLVAAVLAGLLLHGIRFVSDIAKADGDLSQ